MTVTAMDDDRDRVVTAMRTWYARRVRTQTGRVGLAGIRFVLSQDDHTKVRLELDGPGGVRRGRARCRPAGLVMVEALIEAYDESGAWPADRNWERATAKHPPRTHVRVFGSWPTSGGGGGYGGGEAAWRGGTKRSGEPG
jgi:hypothetical protein